MQPAFKSSQLKLGMKVLGLRRISVMKRFPLSVIRSLLLAGMCREFILATVVNKWEVGSNAVFLELTMLAIRL